MNKILQIAIAGACVFSAFAAEATLISFQEGVSPTGAYTQDAVYIRQNEADTNQNGDPDQELIVGFTTDNTELRGLLEFDISTIPATDVIDSVSLGLRTGGGLSSAITINIYEYGSDFDEATATWNAPAPGEAIAGGTLGTLLSSATFNPTVNADITFGNSPAFQIAVSDALAGDGFLRLILARSDNSGPGQNRFARFADETDTPLADRPELVISHIPEPSSLMLLGLGGLLVWRRVRL
jgi:hypothetical protein